MIDYDNLRAEIPVRTILDDIEGCRRMLRDCEALDGFHLRRLDSDDIRSLKASVDIGLAMLKKVMPDLKAEDLNTIKGRERLAFVADLQARMSNPGIGDGERRAYQLDEILNAVADQRISIDEAVKIQNLLNPKTGKEDGVSQFTVIPISDEELKNRLIHYDMVH